VFKIDSTNYRIYIYEMNTRECRLVIDSRERHILRHADILATIRHEVVQMTTGDYSIIDPADRVMAILERKTLNDFGASIKDGRIANKEKLVKLREKTGCTIVYIVEGINPGNSSLSSNPTQTAANTLINPDAVYNGIKYSSIESHIFHLMVRDNITVLYTMNTIDTAHILGRFVQSMNTLYSATKGASPLQKHTTAPDSAVDASPDQTTGTMNTIRADSSVPAATIDGDSTTPEYLGAGQCTETIQQPVNSSLNSANTTTKQSGIQQLRARQVVSDDTIVVKMWSCIPQVAETTAREIGAQWNIYSILSSLIPADTIRAFKGKSGRSLNIRAANSLLLISGPIQANILSTIPRVTPAIAATLLNQYTVAQLVEMDKKILAQLERGDRKKVGPCIADSIQRLLLHKLAPASI
jgi:ERCC4-type nuclease